MYKMFVENKILKKLRKSDDDDIKGLGINLRHALRHGHEVEFECKTYAEELEDKTAIRIRFEDDGWNDLDEKDKYTLAIWDLEAKDIWVLIDNDKLDELKDYLKRGYKINCDDIRETGEKEAGEDNIKFYDDFETLYEHHYYYKRLVNSTIKKYNKLRPYWYVKNSFWLEDDSDYDDDHYCSRCSRRI